MEIKEELINRYCYIYENAKYILAPYIEQYNFNDKKRNKKLRFEKIFNSVIIDIKRLPYNLLIDLESFLLSDIPYNESKFYHELEENKKDSAYLNKVKEGLTLLKQNNDTVFSKYLEIKLDTWTLLLKVRQFIDGQLFDPYNRIDKLNAMDEYFRIARYKNDGKVWTSGCDLNFVDIKNSMNNFYYTNLKEPRYPRDNNDTGLEDSDFIAYLINHSHLNKENESILTEKEKQRIYLKYHDELPWNMEKTCELEKEYLPIMIETRLRRPGHTSACGKTFNIKEDEIFVDPRDSLYRYYQLCPYCGYIVNIKKETLPDTIKQRIEERCDKDPNLFRKMYLYSELFALEKETPDTGKKLLKTRKSNQ